MKENFGVHCHVRFYSGTYGRRDKYCLSACCQWSCETRCIFTEFTNTESYCHPEGIHSVRGRLTFSDDEQPMVAHIWGDKPEQFREMSIGLADMGFKGIDLNMGCPVANVAKKVKDPA